jgi:type VI secretion system protein ImpA
MPSADVLDFPKLLAPIAPDQPVGVDLRADSAPNSPYYLIKDARSAARAIERQLIGGEDEQTAPRPDWRPVVQSATQVLAEKSKDLEITAYLVEALVRLHGFAGLRDGFRLTRELCERFWEGIYPRPDEEGMETRVAALTGLNGEGGDGTLIAPINRVPLTDSPNFGRLSLAAYHEALNLGKLTDVKSRDKRIAAGAVSLEKFEQAVAETPKPFFANLVDDLNKAAEEFGKLTAELSKRCAERAPPSSSIRDALTAVLDCVKNVARGKLETASLHAGAAPRADGVAPSPGGPPQATDVLGNREDALRILLKVADFFRRTEPHNPVSYALEQAVRWAQLPLPELLVELIPDEAPRKGLFKQVGIKPPETPKEPAKK